MRRTRERGTTLAEVMVVVALLSIIALPILSTLRSSTRHDDRITADLDAAAQYRRVQELWLDDVRTGTIALGAPSPLDGTHTLRIVGDGEEIRWRRTERGLERRIVDVASGTVVADVLLVDGATVDGAALDLDDARATFAYRSALGAALDPTAVGVIDRCATAVSVSLWDLDAADPVFALTASARAATPAPDEACP